MSKLPEHDMLSFGNIAKVMGDVPDHEVNRAIAVHREHPETPLGEAMVQVGAIEPERLRELLEKQRTLRDGKVTTDDVVRVLDFAAKSVVKQGAQLLSLARSWKRH